MVPTSEEALNIMVHLAVTEDPGEIDRLLHKTMFTTSDEDTAQWACARWSEERNADGKFELTPLGLINGILRYVTGMELNLPERSE